ncbi:MAG: HAD hydrolase-like protein [Thermodesulfobacteriota bacterium]|nr:HAD hydrolase-like protein [Thermodesulfobacteriota bacterium]
MLDSVDVKTRAFAKMFNVYGPEVERQVVDFHLKNGGISRFEKFRYFYENFLHKPVSENKLRCLGKEFSDIVFTEVVGSEFIDGALEALVFLKEKRIMSFVASGTPHEELSEIVSLKKISQYFVEVHGSPRKKSEIVSNIMEKFSMAKERCLFVGDAMTDYDAALALDIDFLGVVPVNSFSPFPQGTQCCASLSRLPKMIL